MAHPEEENTDDNPHPRPRRRSRSLSRAAAFAAPAGVEVKYNDLDLSTPQGAAELDKRVDRAAKKVCTTHGVMTGTIATSKLDRECYQEALAKLKDRLAAVTGHKQQG